MSELDDSLYAAQANSPSGQGPDGGRIKHKRGYQACEPCRERKVKCDMGPVDNPHGPPCKKCAREQKECYMAATRRKTKTGSPKPFTAPSSTSEQLKRTGSDASMPDGGQRPFPVPFSSGRSDKNSLFSPTMSNGFTPPSNTSVTSLAGAGVTNAAPFTTPSSSGNGLRKGLPQMLATKEMASQGHDMEQLISNTAQQTLGMPVASSQDGMRLLFDATRRVDQSPNMYTSPNSDAKRQRAYSYVLGGGSEGGEVTVQVREEDVDQALDVWSRMRFVRSGWFTADEAMRYIEFFYERLAPMTPVKTPDFRSPKKHFQLLTEEPVLALAILTISSRQFLLTGPAAGSRSYNVHDKLWNALQRMIQRLLWGQEQFGGGFCGAGSAPVRESSSGQITWKGSLRTLGTIEALLLLTDWQPRALHFPPSEDEMSLVDPLIVQEGSAIHDDARSHELFPHSSALEPGWRSDRMSWMLLGLAQSLAFELGAFDNSHDSCGQDHSPGSDCERRRRIRRLVLLYVTQTSGRLGIKSMLSPSLDKDEVFDQGHSVDEVDTMQACWLSLAEIMYQANQTIFPSKVWTRQITKSGQYKNEIAKLVPQLQKWKSTFDQVCNRFNVTMRHVLAMEYEYARMFINSLGFNKVVEAWKEEGPHVDKSTLIRIAEENKHYTTEVREAAMGILENALAGFAYKNQLQNAAVRTYLRSFAGMVFTLKLFCLGNHATTVQRLIRLIERMVSAMQRQVVDDVHISNSAAEMVHTLVLNVRQTLIRIAGRQSNGSGSSSRGQSRPHSPVRAPVQKDMTSLGQGEGAQPLDLSPDPLAEIEAQPLTAFAKTAFIPPPNFNALDDMAMTYDPNIDPTMAGFEVDADWFTLPLDGVLADGNGQVQPGWGGIGPLVGDRDLLDVLTGHEHGQMWNGGSASLPNQPVGPSYNGGAGF